MRAKIGQTYILLALIALPAYSQDNSYICISDESVGFVQKNGQWSQSRFDVAEQKYILRPLKKGDVSISDEFNYGVFPIGSSDTPIHWCVFEEYKGDFICRAGEGSFMFSPKSGGFIKTYVFGYWDNSTDNPNISRGRCSKL